MASNFDPVILDLMKEPGRRIRGKVEVTYVNALYSTSISVSEGAHGALGAQLSDAAIKSSATFFKLNNNKLDGSFKLIGETASAGWWPKTMPDASGIYEVPQTLQMSFSTRNIYGLSIYGDVEHEAYPTDFTLRIYSISGAVETFTVENLTVPEYHVTQKFNNVNKLEITIYKSSQPYTPAVIMEVPIVSSVVYDADKLIDIHLLEELTYEDSLAKLGGVSANEITVNFNNEDKSFYFNNPTSKEASYLKKNRRIRAWLGVEVPYTANEVLWSSLGTFWTHDWEVPVGSLLAKAVAFDTLGLLSTKKFFKHNVYRNRSIGWLLDMIFTTAKEDIEFLEWSIEPSLYDTIVPIAWFMHDTYTAALNRIASCDMIHIYCDREGRVVVSRRVSVVQHPDDVWSDSTNVIDKRYPTLNTAPPNYLDVKVTRVRTSIREVLNISDSSVTVHPGDIHLLNFSYPVERLESITINTTATYTYEMYSWGLRVTFTSTGIFNGGVVMASALETDTPFTVHLQSDEAIEEDGIVPCEITSDFIQTAAQAQYIAQYLYRRLSDSLFDVEVTYRGDIALTLNSKISLPDGIAPNNLYFIKRHELHWNGGLSGTALLST